MSRPKVVAVIPIHRRAQMAIETVRMLRHQTVEVVTILIGSDAEDARIAAKVGCEYVQYPNAPLSSKWQAGVWRAGDIYPKAILILGSDTWLTPTWCATGLKTMRRKRCHAVGRDDIYVMHLTQNRAKVIHREYMGPRRGLPAGPGRMISREGMKALDWILFKERKSKHCDGIAWRAIRDAGLKYALISGREKILTIACDEWPSKHTFADVAGSAGLRKMTAPHTGWVAATFPGSREAIGRLRQATW